MLPANVKAILQAIRIGLDVFILAYKAARKMQANKVRRQIEDTSQKIRDPSLTLEERLKLNAEMESHFKHFVDKSAAK